MNIGIHQRGICKPTADPAPGSAYNYVSPPPVNPMARKPLSAKTPSKQAIFRAVASSTAIETGKSVRTLEKLLRDGASGKQATRLRSLVLAK